MFSAVTPVMVRVAVLAPADIVLVLEGLLVLEPGEGGVRAVLVQCVDAEGEVCIVTLVHDLAREFGSQNRCIMYNDFRLVAGYASTTVADHDPVLARILRVQTGEG